MQVHSDQSNSNNVFRSGKHDLLWTILKILLLPATVYMSWKAVSIATDSRYPIVVVISESMEPAFSRGDLLFLWNRKHIVEVGDIPVCWFPGNPLPMVHRAISVMYNESELSPGTVVQHILTKGDNNMLDDTSMYPPGQSHVMREEVVGLVRGYVPYLGWLTIALTDYPWLKVIATLAAVVGALLN